ncbi:hypothetical protein [Cryocola sp. 340MFSha3.1]|uniref:hypothetical protein n=1 Tax=Cryocola sp. 340MFSha3.1 TaxID=1169145 RepID=UPI0003A61F26|nr:hypothetical protein [Cryocola sp. 340MFSha3.1]
MKSDPGSAPLDLRGRDLVVDGARVASVVVVVVAHLLLIGVGRDADGSLTITKPLAEQPWFPVVSVLGQVMPLFFALGGFTAYTGWRSLRSRGGEWTEFVRARVLRLARPSLPLFAFFAATLSIAALAGAPTALVRAVAAGVGTPLWFLAAFVLCQWAAPAMIALHERAPYRTLAALAAAALTVDAARSATGIEAIGLLNTAFVWLFAQQLGFFYADGRLLRAPRVLLAAAGTVTAALLVAGMASDIYSPDMLRNQYPPLFALGLLGVTQLCVLALLHPALTAVMRGRAAQAVTFLVGSRLMTVYLWHLTCIVVIIGVCLLVPGWTPQPGSPAWWSSRPLVLIAAAVLVGALSLLVVRFERTPPLARASGMTVTRIAPWRIHLASACVFLPAFAIMCWGLDLWNAVFALVSYGAVMLLARVVVVRQSVTTP